MTLPEPLGRIEQCWVAVGDQANWDTGLSSGQIWGLVSSHQNHWDRMESGDILLMYVTAPVKGVVGAGLIRRKFRQTSPLWKEEIEENRVIWELRFEFDVLMLLPVERWRQCSVSGREHGLALMAGISPVAPEKAVPVLEELRNRVAALGVDGSEDEEVVVREPEPALVGTAPEESIPALSLHDQTQETLVEIGRIQRLFPEKEYAFDGGRLDVIWRRALRSVPTYAFEVHVSGSLESALSKLNMAHRLWNSRPYLVTEEETNDKARYLLDNAFPEIKSDARVLTLNQIRELHDRKRAYYDLESELGLT